MAASGKMALLDRMLARLKATGHRVLIFSQVPPPRSIALPHPSTQMTRMLDIIEDYMSLRGLECARLDGNTDLADRDQSIRAFNAGDSRTFAFLLSTRAGPLNVILCGCV